MGQGLAVTPDPVALPETAAAGPCARPPPLGVAPTPRSTGSALGPSSEVG
ncbi:hypothetical protein [Modestobacter italicus]|nr:hypothetical protein [Modestobacter italicus]